MKSEGCQFLIAGGGIIGLTVARELLLRGATDIVVLEKEDTPGRHASGRNSGILHAGIYYSSDSLKAKYCVDGNRLMKEYCRQKGLALLESGKVIVAKDEAELGRLHQLKARADLNGAQASLIGQKELTNLEPHARTCQEALYAPETAVVDPLQILQSIDQDLTQSGKVRILYNTAFLELKNRGLAMTSQGSISFERFINTAGTFADRIAHHFGIGKDYRILPFKGTYKRLALQRSYLVRGNIYPVPDLRNPFLGVHFSRKVDGHVYIGPTAIPAFGRENYEMLPRHPGEACSILYRDAVLWLMNPAFRSKAFSEMKKYSREVVFHEAQNLVPELKLDDVEDSDKVGIRAQLVHWPKKVLVMDFVVLKQNDSVHVLNAVSPAFTSSMAFAKHIADLAEAA